MLFFLLLIAPHLYLNNEVCMIFLRLLSLFFVFLLVSCVSKPPHNVNNVCSIFNQYPSWYQDAKEAERRWHVPVAVQMAIIHQESKFDAKAVPSRNTLFWIIPWNRPSSAYGYTQALHSTWKNYKQANGSLWSSRDNFTDAVDFVGWYANQAAHRARIAPYDAYNLYLAYHEGIGGYERKTYLKKQWLINVARKVRTRASIFQAQMAHCNKASSSSMWYK